MTVRIAAAVVIFAYICALPVYIALFAQFRDSTKIGAGFSVWIPQIAVRTAEKRALESRVRGATRRRTPREKGGFSVAALPAAWTLLRSLAKHVRIEDLSVTGSVCASDAARTALLCGCAWSARNALSACGATVPYISLVPDFSCGTSDIRVVGMISIRVGHIILATIPHMKELINLWKSTRSKAS